MHTGCPCADSALCPRFLQSFQGAGGRQQGSPTTLGCLSSALPPLAQVCGGFGCKSGPAEPPSVWDRAVSVATGHCPRSGSASCSGPLSTRVLCLPHSLVNDFGSTDVCVSLWRTCAPQDILYSSASPASPTLCWFPVLVSNCTTHFDPTCVPHCRPCMVLLCDCHILVTSSWAQPDVHVCPPCQERLDPGESGSKQGWR